ncbi:hypothetical protein GQ472_06095 [archaeon]|nr:hypothetical protein [archaeon]
MEDSETRPKTVQEMWYASPTIRNFIFRQYSEQWGGDIYTKELFLLGHEDVKTSRHGLTCRDLTADDPERNAWHLMEGCNVYQSLLSYDQRFPLIQEALVNAIRPNTQWFTAMAGHQVFRALKFRADLIRSFTFAFDIDAHDGDENNLKDTHRQAYMIGSYLKDSYSLEPILNMSGGGAHVRIPDFLIAHVIDVPRLINDNIGYRYKDYGWVDMRPINDVLVSMTKDITDKVFGDEPNNVDMNLHNNSGRVFRTLYTIHPKTGVVLLPSRLKDLESEDYEPYNIHDHDGEQVNRYKMLRTDHRPLKYTHDWYGGDGCEMSSNVRSKVKSLLDIFFQHTPVGFHKYLRSDGLDQ